MICLDMFSNTYLASEIISQLNYTRLRKVIHLRLVSKAWRNAYDTTENVWDTLHYEDILYNRKYLEVDNIIHLIRDTPFSKYLKEVHLIPNWGIDVLYFSPEQFDLLCKHIPLSTQSMKVNVFSPVDLGVLVNRNINLRKLYIYQHVNCNLLCERMRDNLICLIFRGLRKISVLDWNTSIIAGNGLRGYIDYISYRNLTDIESLLRIGVKKINILFIDEYKEDFSCKNMDIILDSNIKVNMLSFWGYYKCPFIVRKNNVKELYFYRGNSEMINKVISLSDKVRNIRVFVDTTSSIIDSICSKDNIELIRLTNITDEWLDKITNKFSSTLRVLRILKISYLSSNTIRYISRLKNLEVLSIEIVKYCTPLIMDRVKKMCKMCRYLHVFDIKDLHSMCKDIARRELRYLWEEVV